MKKLIKKYQLLKNKINPFLDKDLLRRIKIIKFFKIDVLFDIGANNGQYAVNMRKIGYDNKIISFEPLKSAYEDLERASFKDDDWIINDYAIGDKDSLGVINVSNNSFSSSILNMLSAHIDSAPNSNFIGTQEIAIKKIDSVFNSFTNLNDRIMLKIDTQGYEKKVIEGAINSLKNVLIIQIEMSIVQLYEGELEFIEMIELLKDKGFKLISLENGFSNLDSGQLLQVDGIFINKLLT
jgi:FkbM family methyltransferase